MSTTTMTTRDRGDRYGPMEWAQQDLSVGDSCVTVPKPVDVKGNFEHF